MKSMRLVLGILISTQLCHSQITPIEIGRMTDLISEPSGIQVMYNKSTGQFDYWMNNDYNYPDSIFSFRLDQLDTPSRVLDINQAYYDWEDMTSDEEGNLYLGDFGNWVPKDKLQIIKVPDPNTYSAAPPNTTVIRYEYPFTGVSDMEAMFHHENFIYLLTKTVRADQNPRLNDDYTYLFRIPDTKPDVDAAYVAELMDSLLVKLPTDPDAARVKVTGADMSPDKKQLVLLCYERIWLFSCFDGPDFFGGEVNHFQMDYKQYEGIAFLDNHEVILSKEGAPDDPNYNPILYYLNLSPHLSPNCLECNKVINGNFDNTDLAWTFFLHGGGTADADLDISVGRAELTVSQLSSSQWHANMRHKSLILEKGKTYELNYTAHADLASSMSVIVNSADGSTGYFYKRIDLSTEPVSHTHEFIMEEDTDFNSYLSFNVGNSALTTIYLDDISLVDDCAKLTDLDDHVTIEPEPLQIFPNPVSDIFEINYPEWSSNTKAEIYNGTGSIIGTYYSKRIPVSDLTKGVHYLVIKESGLIKEVETFLKM